MASLLVNRCHIYRNEMGGDTPEDKKVFKNMFSEQKIEPPALKMEMSNKEFYLLELFRH